MQENMIIDEVPGLYRMLALKPMRKTAKVTFDCVAMEFLPRIDAIDRVIHEGGAISPGQVGDVVRPWYMHPGQDDNLLVLNGIRHVELYSQAHGRIENFTVTPQSISKNGQVVYEGGAMLVWPRRVFHRIRSGEEGSASLNFAIHYEGFDIRTNFNIYALDAGKGEFSVIREGHLDQFPGPVGAA
ncbi:MAG: hypothetical protein PHI06_03455 [Desulfobulbaceae bacterium]|nr:hypothetical protein [Desulfobulbaceae bacterium]